MKHKFSERFTMCKNYVYSIGIIFIFAIDAAYASASVRLCNNTENKVSYAIIKTSGLFVWSDKYSVYGWGGIERNKCEKILVRDKTTFIFRVNGKNVVYGISARNRMPESMRQACVHPAKRVSREDLSPSQLTSCPDGYELWDASFGVNGGDSNRHTTFTVNLK